jgi:hypothetical protein
VAVAVTEEAEEVTLEEMELTRLLRRLPIPNRGRGVWLRAAARQGLR